MLHEEKGLRLQLLIPCVHLLGHNKIPLVIAMGHKHIIKPNIGKRNCFVSPVPFTNKGPRNGLELLSTRSQVPHLKSLATLPMAQ